MNRFKMYFAAVAMAFVMPLQLFAQTEQEEGRILQLVQQFFDALEKQDTATFKELCLKDARNFAVRKIQDSVVVRTQLSSAFRFNPKRILKERMRMETTEIKVHDRVAMAWVPYDLWINDTFSHCGVDVFTFVQTDDGWKISSLAYTIETAGCE